jgi:hypothetical protein
MSGRRVLRLLVSPAALTLAALLPATASAATPIRSFNAIPSTTQAGAHPDIAFSFRIGNRQLSGEPDPCGCNEDARNVTVHLPTGLIGSPRATPQCMIAQFSVDQCPVDSQLGMVEFALLTNPGLGGGGAVVDVAPVFNLVPPPTEPALLAFKVSLVNSPTFEVVSARTDSDYGVDTTVYNIDHVVPLYRVKQVVWGVPADHAHDRLRWELSEPPLALILARATDELVCDAAENPSTDDPASMVKLCSEYATTPGGSAGLSGPVASNSPRIPFFQNPTTCGETSLITSLDILSYDLGETHAESPYPATTDCALLTFNPSQSIEPTTTAADSPSGAEVRLTVPQFESPDVPSPSELRAALVTFPKGFSLAPNVTNGKQTCSDGQARFGTTREAQCPEDSKIGTISVETPVLPGPLPGAVYLGEPKPGNRFRIILAFDGFGVHVKLAGNVIPDPTTGQIVVSFQNLPQAPFESFNMHVFGSERGPLDTPTQCGTYEVLSEWTPWDSALSEQTSRQFFQITEGPDGTPCPNGPRPFRPGFKAVSVANTAGAHTSFWLNLTREDGEQDLAALKITTPPGLTAILKGVSYCPQASIEAAEATAALGGHQLLAPSCPASSLVGEVVGGAGSGTHPLYLPGKVYLAGPYRGSPLSFVFIVPAVSGGYDLGNVVVREGLNVDPETAQVTTAGGQLPQIFAGIPLRLRQVFVNLNRPDFALNPTNCEPLSVGGQLFGTEGGLSSTAQHFQVANCASLPFAPKLSLKLTGGVNRRGHPAIHATFTAKPGEANSASVSVALPPGELLDNAHIQSPCTRAALNANHCPAGSVLGHARAITPLLDAPLEGPVYLTTGFGHRLPDVVADLRGQFHIRLDGRVDTVNGGSLRTTFQSLPDAPISTFTLDLAGGAKGLLQNSQGLCATHKRATAKMAGQNGMSLTRRVPLQISCGRAGRHRRPHRRGGGA